MIAKFSTTTLLLLFITSIFAQGELDDQSVSSPTTAIRDLKDGILIVRLTSDYRKITELERLRKEESVSVENRLKLPERLRKIKAIRDRENALWIEHFQNEYSFSEVYFCYDTLRKEPLLYNDGKNCFLNKKFKIDPALSLEGRDFLMLYKGSAGEAGVEALIFRDASFQELSKPFPYYIKTTGLMYFFNKIFKESIADDRNIRRVVRRLDQKLHSFYERRL